MDQFLVLCGVSGCGKTTIGKALAEKLNFNFLDADDFHPLENKVFMSKGIPLNDSQREPWLLSLHEKLKELKSIKQNSILACSALKSKYRKMLNFGRNVGLDCLNLKFILLEIDYDLVEARLNSRNHEFVKGSSILKTQFEILEIFEDLDYRLKLTSEKNVENCVQELLSFLIINKST